MKKIIFMMSIVALALCSCVCKKTEKATHSQALQEANSASIEKYWKLIELSGNPLTGNMQKIPHVILKADGKFSGNTGCNNMTGSYELKDSYRINFSKAATTMMMCINDMDTEKDFLHALEIADSYILKNDTLILNRARMAPLARFVAVYLE